MIRRAAAAALVAAGCALALAACGEGSAGSSGTSSATASVAVTDAWARPTPAGASTGAVYLDLESAMGDALIGVRVDASVAAGAELHMTMAAGDTSMSSNGAGGVTMHAVSEIALPPGQPVELAPGGTHVMLVDLAEPLVEGETFDLTLDFADADDEVVTVEVRNEVS